MRLPAYQDLSTEQDKALNLPLDGNFLLGGPPGTGKTVIAIYRAKMLADTGNEPRLLMYNNVLAQYTSDATEHLNISVYVNTFHRWFKQYYREHYGKGPPELENFVYDWRAIFEVMATCPPRTGRVSHVIVDEGQDLPKEFYSVLRYFIGDNLTILADENQRITDSNSTFQDLKDVGGAGTEGIHFLRRNYRNTREIAELARNFYRGAPTGVPDLPERLGSKPRILQFSGRSDETEMIYRHSVNHSDRTVGVFVSRTAQQMSLLRDLRRKYQEAGASEAESISQVQTYSYNNGERRIDSAIPGIKIINYMSAKGLEFDSVFMPRLDEYRLDLSSDEAAMKLYVLLSRARTDLFLTFMGAMAPEVVACIPKDLVDFRDQHDRPRVRAARE